MNRCATCKGFTKESAICRKCYMRNRYYTKQKGARVRSPLSIARCTFPSHCTCGQPAVIGGRCRPCHERSKLPKRASELTRKRLNAILTCIMQDPI